MSHQQPAVVPSSGVSDSPSDTGSFKGKSKVENDGYPSDSVPPTAPALAAQQGQRMEAAMGDAILRFLRIRKPRRNDTYDLDAVATQPSIWDSPDIERYKELYIHPQWENWSAFDPNFRWTWREENAVRHKVDWKIMVWMCIMFAALNIDRNNIQNAVSDNMLDDLGITHADYNIGQTISRVGFLVAELPSQLISKRIGPDMWIPIQLCIFSLISAMQFFLKGRASFLATRYLIATFQGGFIPYWYTGTRLPIRLAWFWMSSQLVDIGVGFAAVGMLSMRGMLGYEVLIGVASFFLMPQSPAKTKSWWNPKGYFTEHEQKIIVNSVIRDDPQKGGMYNRQGLSVRQIWECTKDYDMWPLYALGLLFGLPKYPVNQYLTLSFRGLGFNVIETNLLSIPYIVGSCITMLAITAFKRGSLTAPSTHPIQVAWTSRNAGSVQNRTVSASLYNMWVQVSGMIGANIYQPSDSPRYFKANTGLLVICVWMCLVQYPGTFFYYRWRNNQKAKKWDAMTPEEQHQYRTTTTDKGNKR
ncbi:major facilitator superfamily domain-containing protein [Fusarium redolens]|uniref:Major facilitator superfamily domain-containing protein n=1 Tax=Fusarium redolens TaxID=48865 RepID=A0A9P9GBW9_FUSRE|nr:major facilitator superfamily domain-containing protein [Fusarium redolens]KAH7236734.1 major facilitator superfamily domain-containing protein [Fusarium redolens]